MQFLPQHIPLMQKIELQLQNFQLHSFISYELLRTACWWTVSIHSQAGERSLYWVLLIFWRRRYNNGLTAIVFSLLWSSFSGSTFSSNTEDWTSTWEFLVSCFHLVWALKICLLMNVSIQSQAVEQSFFGGGVIRMELLQWSSVSSCSYYSCCTSSSNANYFTSTWEFSASCFGLVWQKDGLSRD